MRKNGTRGTNAATSGATPCASALTTMLTFMASLLWPSTLHSMAFSRVLWLRRCSTLSASYAPTALETASATPPATPAPRMSCFASSGCTTASAT